MASRQITLQQINDLDQRSFVTELGALFEGTPWIVEEAWHARPFSSPDDLFQTLCAVMYSAPFEKQVKLIQAHPDLVGRAALAGTLTPASTSEQASAGLDRLSQDEIDTFTRNNQSYRNRFGFPFVICARLNKKEAILNGFRARISHLREEEIKAALDEIFKIAEYRLKDVVAG